MTTIATDGRTMAGDGLTSCNGHVLAHPVKVWKTASGEVFGSSGLTTQCEKFRQWMMAEGPGDFPALDDDFNALILGVDGTVRWIDKHNAPVFYTLPAAIGSGSEYAIGAMLAGKTPEEAVKIAMVRDRGTAGEITTIAIGD